MFHRSCPLPAKRATTGSSAIGHPLECEPTGPGVWTHVPMLMAVVAENAVGDRTKPERRTKFLFDLVSGFSGGSRTLDRDRCYADRFRHLFKERL